MEEEMTRLRELDTVRKQTCEVAADSNVCKEQEEEDKDYDNDYNDYYTDDFNIADDSSHSLPEIYLNKVPFSH